jgi:hypothetical protein
MPRWSVAVLKEKKINSSVMIKIDFLGSDKIKVSYLDMSDMKFDR